MRKPDGRFDTSRAANFAGVVMIIIWVLLILAVSVGIIVVICTSGVNSVNFDSLMQFAKATGFYITGAVLPVANYNMRRYIEAKNG